MSIKEKKISTKQLDTPLHCILIANPGRLREGLQALVRAIDLIDVVGVAGGGLSASKLIRNHSPEIVIMDGNIAEDEILEILLWLRSSYPKIKVLMLVENNHQRKNLLEAGVDFLISKGFLTEQLVDVVESLLIANNSDFLSDPMNELYNEDTK